MLKENYNDYIVKPQKEGGSKNYCGEEILKLLPEDLNTLEENKINQILIDSIIMENCEIMTDVKIKNSIISSNSRIFQAENEEKELLLGEGTSIKI